jgi:hypothetical protein
MSCAQHKPAKDGANWESALARYAMAATVFEGRTKQHIESTPLAAYWTGWNGELEPDRAYVSLARRLENGRQSP